MASEKAELPVSESPVETDSPSPKGSTHGVNTTEKPEKSRFQKVSAFFGDWYYVWEVFGIVVSGLAIISICIVVYYFDDREAPNWTAKVPGRDKPFQLTLNSLLSILSVFGSTCAMIPVTKGLGQLKYLWFMEQDRNLADLETFDSASRGKVGSAQLIWKLRFKHLAVLGGLASLLALAYGPFVQNLIVINIEYRDANQDALVSYQKHYFYNEENNTDVDRAMAFAIHTAVKDSSRQWTAPPNQCKTGECFWEDYYTTAACTRCTDITHLVERTCTPVNGTEGGCDLALPNGFAFSNTGSDVWGIGVNQIVMAMNTTNEPLVYNYTSPLITVQSIMGFDPSQFPTKDSKPSELKPYTITKDSPLSAHECVIIPCVQKQRFNLSRQADNTTKSQLIASDDIIPVVTIVDDHWDNYTVSDASTLNDIFIDFDYAATGMTPEEMAKYDSFSISAGTYSAMANFLNALLNGWVSTGPGDTPETMDTIRFLGTRDPNSPYAGRVETAKSMEAIFANSHAGNWTGAFCNKTLATSNDVECAMRNIAAGITNGMRMESWDQIDENRVAMEGTTREPRQICHAQWQYISAPAAVWLLGLALFIGVVWKTRRAQIKAWRTSPLATLLLRLDPDSREHLKDWQNMGDGELRELAEGLRLRLHVDEGGPRFVTQGNGPPEGQANQA